MEQLRPQVTFSYWEPCDENRTVVRFATGWSTTVEDLAALDALL